MLSSLPSEGISLGAYPRIQFSFMADELEERVLSVARSRQVCLYWLWKLLIAIFLSEGTSKYYLEKPLKTIY